MFGATGSVRVAWAAVGAGIWCSTWSSSASGSSASAAVSLFNWLCMRFMSRSPVQRATTTVATPLPIRLVSARASDMKRSMPRISANPATGTPPTAERVAASTMKPLPVMPAAPLEVSSRTPSSVSCCVSVIGVLVACAMNTAAMVR